MPAPSLTWCIKMSNYLITKVFNENIDEYKLEYLCRELLWQIESLSLNEWHIWLKNFPQAKIISPAHPSHFLKCKQFPLILKSLRATHSYYTELQPLPERTGLWFITLAIISLYQLSAAFLRNQALDPITCHRRGSEKETASQNPQEGYGSECPFHAHTMPRGGSKEGARFRRASNRGV